MPLQPAKKENRVERLEDFDAPWCQEILQSTNHVDKSFPRVSVAVSEQAPNLLVTETLFSDCTIRAWRYLQAKNVIPPNIFREHLLIVSLGRGLSGYKETLHGGVLGVLSDQATGMCVTAEFVDKFPVTAECKLRFLKAVSLPSVVMCRTILSKVEGRKMWIRCSIENGTGVVHAVSETLYVLPRPAL